MFDFNVNSLIFGVECPLCCSKGGAVRSGCSVRSGWRGMPVVWFEVVAVVWLLLLFLDCAQSGRLHNNNEYIE